jgi:transcriptional regulator with GAF, ATPase, and Fis domain
LPKEIREGRFRSDLYYRLNVFPVQMPPLRARREDIPLLVQHFVRKYAPRIGRQIHSIDEQTLRYLMDYSWPGNIRELENIVERALVLTDSSTLSVEPEVIGISVAPRLVSPQAAVSPDSSESEQGSVADLNRVQRDHILSTLRTADWVVEGERGAAKLLGMKPATLRHRMKKLGISREPSAVSRQLD